MTSSVFCTLDTNACGAGLIIAADGLIVTTIEADLNLSRAVLGNLAVRADGVYAIECYHWSVSRGDLAGLVSIGVSDPNAPLDAAVGDSELSWGYRPAEGQIWNDGAAVATVDATAERTAIGVLLSLSATNCTVSWFAAGSILHTATLPNGAAWVPAFSLASTDVDPGDVSLVMCAGQHRFDCPTGTVESWSRSTVGLATMYASKAEEAFMSSRSDSPFDQAFEPAILQAERFSWDRMPRWWPASDGDGVSSTAFGRFRLDNSDGRYSALARADVRDSVLLAQRIDAPAGGAGSLLDASVQCTAIIDDVSRPTAATVDIALKGTLARLDKPLRCRVVPPFADEASRGRIQPVGIGAQRTVQPILWDEAELIYLLGDAAATNITLVSDGGAALDPNAQPAQWRPALGGRGIQLEAAPVFRLSVDYSTVGEQYDIPGADDVLEGSGGFDTWKSGAPVGWEQLSSPYGSITQTAIGDGSALTITSNINYNPQLSGNRFGYWVKLVDPVLEPGRSYRISFRLSRVSGTNTNPGGASSYGVALLTALDHYSGWWITPHEEPLSQHVLDDRTYTFDYTVPGDSLLPIYICVFSDTGLIPSLPTTLQASARIDDLRVELLGQYVALPLEGMTLTEAFTAVLVDREGEPPSVFSAEDTQAIDDATGYRIGMRYVDPPNVAGMLQRIAKNWGAVVFEDKHNVIRVRRITDPTDGDIVCALEESDVDLSDERNLQIWTDDGIGLTTIYGARRNQDPMSPGDFVTDAIGVPPTQREQWQGTSQVRFSASVRPAQEYAAAIGAGRFHMDHDDPETARVEANRVVSMYAARDGGFGADRSGVNTTAPTPPSNGKRNFYQFPAWIRSGQVGSGPAISPEDLLPGDKLTLHLPQQVGATKRLVVLGVSSAPFGTQVIITARD